MYEGHNISPTSKGSPRALFGPVVKGNCAIRAVSDTKSGRYGKGTTVHRGLVSDIRSGMLIADVSLRKEPIIVLVRQMSLKYLKPTCLSHLV